MWSKYDDGSKFPMNRINPSHLQLKTHVDSAAFDPLPILRRGPAASGASGAPKKMPTNHENSHPLSRGFFLGGDLGKNVTRGVTFQMYCNITFDWSLQISEGPP